jgi:Peptidase family M23
MGLTENPTSQAVHYTDHMILGLRTAILSLMSVLTVNFQGQANPPVVLPQTLRILFRPAQPYIETRKKQQLLNFDLLVENRSPHLYHLVAIKLRVFDHANKLEEEREINENGFPSALAAVGTISLAARSSIDLFQPFFSFDPDLELTRLHFDLFFMQDGRKALPVPFTADQIASIDVRPRPFQPTAFCLPLHGPILVHDGHDFDSHHRRRAMPVAFDSDVDNLPSTNLYAYDFVVTDASGKLYGGDYTDKHNWLTYGAIIFAPADGIVASIANDIPENTFTPDGSAVPPAGAVNDPEGLGNHVVIKHADGRVSWFLHLQPGSITIKPGDHVHVGDYLGKVGFTGDSLFPHLHYTVTNAVTFPSQGVPSYFKNFTRLLGGSHLLVQRGQVDTGDLIKSDLQTCR